ncbi:MAG: exodeoxyribonuclease III [Parcubacteria group bacterium RIFOXYD2_FULL_52_8]|nr:MAG: exodeoxyribonuclease III [Parcubacteria group bacterium RIFOXYD2_FULL_52_8]
MKIFTWNVNGIRSVFKTTFREWLRANDPDIVCLQEIKCDYTELEESYTQLDGYYAYFNSSSRRKGHAGVAVYTKVKPELVEVRIGIEKFDDEGRCLKLTFKDFVLFNFYIPNGGREKLDIPYKLEVYHKLFPIVSAIADKEVILTGDFNIAHTELDLYYPRQNEHNTMYTPIEREQITKLISLGYTDAFRYKHPDKKSYTWWSYAYEARANDIGWRIDYFFVSKSLVSKVQDVFMERETLGSDHGPIGMTLDKRFTQSEPPVHKKRELQSALF